MVRTPTGHTTSFVHTANRVVAVQGATINSNSAPIMAGSTTRATALAAARLLVVYHNMLPAASTPCRALAEPICSALPQTARVTSHKQGAAHMKCGTQGTTLLSCMLTHRAQTLIRASSRSVFLPEGLLSSSRHSHSRHLDHIHGSRSRSRCCSTLSLAHNA